MAIFDLTTTHGKEDYFSLYKINLPENYSHKFHWFSHKSHQVATQSYLPKQPKGSVFLIHGYYDHVGIYWPIIKFLLSRDIAVFSYDNIGHGLSSGKRASIDSFDEYQDLLDDLLTDFECNHDFPKPYTLIGQSMGGAICLEYFKRQQSMGIFDKSFLLAPLVRPYNWDKAKWLFYAAKYLMPWKKEVPRKYSLRSHDQAFQEFTLVDPLQPRVLPVAWVNAMKNWFKEFESTNFIVSHENNLLSVFLASDDKTIDSEISKKVISQKFADVVFDIVQETFHHLIQEHAFIELLEKNKNYNAKI